MTAFARVIACDLILGLTPLHISSACVGVMIFSMTGTGFGFLAVVFLAVVFLAVVFFAAVFFGVGFFAGAFFVVVFFAVDFTSFFILFTALSEEPLVKARKEQGLNSVRSR